MGQAPLRWLGALAALPVTLVVAETGYACEPQPYLLIRPRASGAAGAEVTVDGRLFDNGKRIELRWNATDGPLLGTAQTADFAVPVTIPQAPIGLYTLVAVTRSPAGVQGGVARAGFQIANPGEATVRANDFTPAPPPTRPQRSSSPFASVAASVALLAIGALGGGAIMSRRRPKPPAASTTATPRT